MRLAMLLAIAALAAAPAEASPPPLEDVQIADEPPPPPPPPPPRHPPPPPVEEQPRPPGSHKLGFRFGGGAMPIGEQRIGMIGLALGVDRPLSGHWRWLAEYELLWLLPPRTVEEQMSGASSFDGSGHRLDAGLRRQLLAKRFGTLRLLVDGEAGGGAALAVTSGATRVVPHAFAGVRLGYELFARSSSKSWGFTLAFRALRVPDGTGFLAGISLTWGT